MAASRNRVLQTYALIYEEVCDPAAIYALQGPQVCNATRRWYLNPVSRITWGVIPMLDCRSWPLPAQMQGFVAD